MLNYKLSQRRFPVDAIQFTYCAVQKLVINGVQILKDLIAWLLDLDIVLFTWLWMSWCCNNIWISDSFQHGGVEVILIAEDYWKLLEQKVEDAEESQERELLIIENLLLLRTSILDWSVYLWYIFGDFFGNNWWTDIIMFCKEHNHFITAELNSHIWHWNRVLDDYSDEGPHHQVEIKGWKIWCQWIHDEFQEIKRFEVYFCVFFLQKLSHEHW